MERVSEHPQNHVEKDNKEHRVKVTDDKWRWIELLAPIIGRMRILQAQLEALHFENT